MTKQRILITGISGLLGSNLAYCLKDRYDILGFYHSHPFKMLGIETRCADLRYSFHPEAFIKAFNPDIVIHCAAQANVDVCEQQQDLAWDSNVKSTQNLLSICEGLPIKFIYISTDLVYDGERGNYSEQDAVGPLNYYAVSKIEGEKLALQRPGSLVLRTNFFGWNVTNKYSLAEWVVKELSMGNRIKGFADSHFSSIYTFDLANLIDQIIRKDLSGLYNCGCSTSLSKYEFLKQVAKAAGLDEALIEPISVDEANLKAKRSKNISMNVDKLSRDLGSPIVTLPQSIENFARDLKQDSRAKIPGLLRKGEFYPYLHILPYARQCIDDDDIKSVVEVLKSSNLTQGPKIEEFERGLVEMVAATYGIAVNSATSALHVACLAAGVGANDEVITSTNTFVASANCAAYCHARPVLIDIDPKTYNMDLNALRAAITERTKAIIPVHFAGQSCDMASISRIVKDAEGKFGHKIYIIEDASHALGSKYQNKMVGSCHYSDMAVFSFHPAKHITTAEGGAIVTNNKTLHRRCCLFRSHGMTNFVEEFKDRNQAFTEIEKDGRKVNLRNPWYYEQQHLGHNYRISDLQCAVGVSQLAKLSQFMKRRREVVDLYNSLFQDSAVIQCPIETDYGQSNFHLYVLQFDFKKLSITRTQLMSALREQGILTQVHYIPVHTQPYYRQHIGTKWGDCPAAEQYYAKCLSLPLYPGLSDEDVNKVVQAVKQLIA